MARYGRRSNHWLWQPRDSRGRFGSGGGGSEPDPLSEWLFRQKWWVIVLFIIALFAFMLWIYYSGYALVFIIGCFALSLILPLLAEPIALMIIGIRELWRWIKKLRK